MTGSWARRDGELLTVYPSGRTENADTILPGHARPHLEPDDHVALTAVLGRAFDDDPVMRWVFPARWARERYRGEFFRWSLWRCAGQGVTWTTDDLAGAAIWALPDRWQVTLPQLARLTRWTGRGIGRRVPLVTWGLGAVERRHPRDKHLYLAGSGRA